MKRDYADKKILIKPHPREQYGFPWDDLDAEVGEIALAGEDVLDLYPDAEVIFAFTSTIMIKALQENRPFKVVYFRDIKDKVYHRQVKQYSDFLGMGKQYFIALGDSKL